MTILATLETADPVTDAIRAHLDNPGIPVIRICKDYGVSRATFYRHLKTVSRALSPEAPTPVRASAPKAVVTHLALAPEVECNQGCGTLFPEGWTNELVLNHWVHDCKTVSWIIRSDAQKLLREAEECPSESIPRNANLSSSGDSDREPMIPDLPDTTDTANTEGMTSVELITPLNESLPASDDADWFYSLKFDENGNVREGFSYASLLEWYWRDVKPFGTRECVTVTHPRRSR
jgi:hypothetical protein